MAIPQLLDLGKPHPGDATGNGVSLNRGCSHYSCIGIGVGPANLSLASLLHRHSDLPNLFLDRKERFSWHDGQQMPNVSLQVSPLKDLVSLSDPTSEFSFLAYLHEEGRIYHFINAQFDAVPRQEFRNYMEWATHKNPNVVFGEEILSVEFDGTFVVRTNERTVCADNIVVGVGSQPWVPPAVRPALGDSQFHVCDYMEKAGALGKKHVAVIGGGQSGAEVFLDLISRSGAALPAQVSWISRRRNFFPIDDSPFTNEYYTPCYSEYFSGLQRDVRELSNRDLVLTSDGISEATLREIYQRVYVHSFLGDAGDRLHMYPNREVTTVTRRGDGWDLDVVGNDLPGVTERLRADAVIWATGFKPARMDFLDPIADRLQRSGDEFQIDQDYAICWDGPADRNIFIQNAARQQRGHADPNLSLLAWRSQRIVDRLCNVKTKSQLPSFLRWSPAPDVQSPAGA